MSKKEKTPKEKAPPKRNPKEGQVPTLLDIFFSVSRLVVVLVGIITAGLSILSGATFLAAGIRGGIAVLSVGLVLWLAAYTLSRGAYATARQQMVSSIQAARGSNERPSSRVSKEA